MISWGSNKGDILSPSVLHFFISELKQGRWVLFIECIKNLNYVISIVGNKQILVLCMKTKHYQHIFTHISYCYYDNPFSFLIVTQNHVCNRAQCDIFLCFSYKTLTQFVQLVVLTPHFLWGEMITCTYFRISQMNTNEDFWWHTAVLYLLLLY